MTLRRIGVGSAGQGGGHGVMGLIFGAVTAAVYNGVAGLVGGLDLELHESDPALGSSR